MFSFHNKKSSIRYRSKRSVPLNNSSCCANNGSNHSLSGVVHNSNSLHSPGSGNNNIPSGGSIGGVPFLLDNSSSQWTPCKIFYFVTAFTVLLCLSLAPIIFLELNYLDPPSSVNNFDNGGSSRFSSSLHHVVDISNNLLLRRHQQQRHPVHQEEEEEEYDNDNNNSSNDNGNNGNGVLRWIPNSPLARGVSGLPMSETPALIGAELARIENCDAKVDNDLMSYWNDPQGTRDQQFESPFNSRTTTTGGGGKGEFFLTFKPDPGGWNNVRMSLENVILLAAITGRTLVLPPKAPMYLLGTGKEGARNFGDFFPLATNPNFQKHVKIITMEQFIRQHASKFIPQLVKQQNENDDYYKKLLKISDTCIYKHISDIDCNFLYDLLSKHGYQPQIDTTDECFVFDQTFYNKNILPKDETNINRFCGDKRTPFYYSKELGNQQWWHWDAATEPKPKEKAVAKNNAQKKKNHRLLIHFYTFLYFTDPQIDNYYKRFVRDYLHYNDDVYCAAYKIISLLNDEVAAAGGDAANSWSSLHVRRGDLQYKKVKISAEEWYENSKEVWKPHELLYIATDERDKTFFDPFVTEHGHKLRFLDDYMDQAGLTQIDSYYYGMIDTIVASHGRAFCGTWFSTFSGYINRMRGYLGYSMKDSWYSFLDRKDVMQEYIYPNGYNNYHSREWPLGWVGIDGDEIIEHEYFVNNHQQSYPKKNNNKDDAASSKSSKDDQKEEEEEDNDNAVVVERKKPPVISIVDDLKPMDDASMGLQKQPVARGLAGLPMKETPSLQNAKRGHIECEINVDSLAYWNDPQGTPDENFLSPFRNQDYDVKYISFGSDRGGWNNVRMSMEIIFVIAAATGRTIVLPPKEALYLMQNKRKDKHRGFADFFPLYTKEFQKRVPVITLEEFIEREGGNDGRLPIPKHLKEKVMASADHCDKRAKSSTPCGPIHEYLQEVGHSPVVRAKDYCFVFDEDVFEGRDLSPANKDLLKETCGDRNLFYWDSDIADHVLVHFRASEKEYRLLAHFYGFIHFTNPKIDHYYKRFVRDFLHYHDEIYCAAGKIVKAVQLEAKQLGFNVEKDGSGGYSSMHIRRGDFQYKKVKIPAEEWIENTKEIWKPNEILYIATDEKNKTSLDAIGKHHTLRYLDDYWDLAGLGDLDPNYMGMIDTIVACRARAFAGTWFSTFTGYINRMRGYHGMTMMDSWYSFLERKTAVHQWNTPSTFAYAYEWPDGWIGIDGDTWPKKDKF